MTSKTWPRLHVTDAWAPGQRWYCEINDSGQKHRYYPKFGGIVEIRVKQHIYYCRAPVPNQNLHDIMALKFQETHGRNITAAELYRRIPIVQPTTTPLVMFVNDEKGVFKFESEEAFQRLPQWTWEHIYTFASDEL